MAAPSTIDLANLVELLRRPTAYPHRVDEVRVIQTHISYVLLAGAHAYKIKKPVDFGFVNFRSLRRRRHFCWREVQLNSRLSPGLYQGVVPVVRDSAGVHVAASPDAPHPRRGEPAEVIEYAVRMRRLPEEGMMEALVDSGRLPPEKVRHLADRMARFHRAAPGGPKAARFGAPEEIARDWAENFEQTKDLVGVTHSQAQRRLLAEYARASLFRHRSLFLERVRKNQIREGHGDLRTSAVCFDASCSEGICIFDCIEFNRRFRCCDVASDMAFLAMDLELHDRSDLAEAFVEAYVASSEDQAIRSLLPFYGCYRAHVRGKVEGFRFAEAEVSEKERVQALFLSQKAFRLACRYADRDRPPLLVLMSGLPGTGKTTLAGAIATRRPFQVISSDVVRKERRGLSAVEREKRALGEGLYSAQRKRSVYDELHRRAALALEGGRSVILDATFGLRAQRERMRAIAGAQGAYFFCIECRATEAEVRVRMEERERTGSVSDARFKVYLLQRAGFEPLEELDPWSHLVVDTSDTSAPVEVSTASVLAALDERLTPAGVRVEPHPAWPPLAG